MQGVREETRAAFDDLNDLAVKLTGSPIERDIFGPPIRRNTP